MDKVILKYQLSSPDRSLSVRIANGKSSKVLTVGVEEGKVTAWVEIERGTGVHALKFFVFATGREFVLEPGARHVNSIVMFNLVWHIYVSGEKEAN